MLNNEPDYRIVDGMKGQGMCTELFWDEAMLSCHVEWLGSIRLQALHFGWLSPGFCLLLTIASLALLISGHYTQHEHIEGTLVPRDGLLTLVPILPGVVECARVKKGKRVGAGRPLNKIPGDQCSVALGDAQVVIAALQRLKRDSSRLDLVKRQRLAQPQQRDLRSRRAPLHAQIVRQPVKRANKQGGIGRLKTGAAESVLKNVARYIGVCWHSSMLLAPNFDVRRYTT